MSNQETAARLRKEFDGEAKNTISKILNSASGWRLITVVGLVAGGLLCVMAVVLIATQGSTSARAARVNQVNGTCTCIGERGFRGQDGLAGPKGDTGGTGPTGPPGNDGLPGPKGDTGSCSNSNPFCLQGQKGDVGGTGPTGQRGVAGPTGAKGEPGANGPQGLKGEIGPTGGTGPSGPDGPIGTPGICNCLNISLVELQDLQVNGTTNLIGNVTLQGSMDCPGGALAPSCFGLTTCPDFLPCDLRSKSMSIWSSNASEIPYLQLGIAPLDLGKAVINFGAPGSTQRVNTFTVNANGTYVIDVENTDMLHRSLNSNIRFEAYGAVARIDLASQGNINMTADQSIGIQSQVSIFMESQSASVQINGATSYITSIASNHTYFTTDFVVSKNSLLPWFRTQSTSTLQCQTGPPLNAIPGSSMRFGVDLIMDSGTKLLSMEPDGLVPVAGLRLCGTRIQTDGNLLTLQQNTSSDTLDVRAAITNSDGMEPIVFTDGHGARFTEGTFILADQITSSRVDGALYIHTDEYANMPGPVFVGNFSQLVTFRGDVQINGQLNGAGTCIGCASDLRVKEQITNVLPEEDLDAILALPRRVKYKFTKEYQAVDHSVRDYVHHSWIAQELEQVIPRIVRKVNQTVAGVHIDDFRQVLHHQVVPHLVGALKAIHTKQQQLEHDLEMIKKKLGL